MKITDFQKANEIRNEISTIISTIESISHIMEVNLVTNTKRVIVVRDLRRSLTENKINDDLINCQASFVAKLSYILKEYKERLEEEFNKI